MRAAPERTRNHIAKAALQQPDEDADVAPQWAETSCRGGGYYVVGGANIP